MHFMLPQFLTNILILFFWDIRSSLRSVNAKVKMKLKTKYEVVIYSQKGHQCS